MRASLQDFALLSRFVAPEFRHPTRIDREFLFWLDRVCQAATRIHGAHLPFTITSDGRTGAVPGSSKTSLHLFAEADPLDDFSAIDIKYPWLASIGGKTDGVKLAAITEAVVTTPRPKGRGYEFGIEVKAPGGPHLHIGLRTVPANWLFAR